MSYKIKPSDRKLKFIENESIPDHMPKVPSRLLITAPSGSGKTQLMGSLLREDDFGYKDVFKGNVFVGFLSHPFENKSFWLLSTVKF